MFRYFKIFFAFIFIIFILFACSGKKTETAGESSEKTAKKAILSINGHIFYEDDFFDFANTVLKEMNRENLKSPEVFKQLIQEFTEYNVLILEADKRGINVNNEHFLKVLSTFKTDKGIQDLKVYTGSYNTDNKKLMKQVTDRLKIEALLDRDVNSRISISENELKKQFNAEAANKENSLKVHVYHIFNTKEDVIKKAMEELHKGLSFNEVAERYSEGPERKNGGDLGIISSGDFPDIFDEAFKLQSGKYSDIVKSDYGFHIFYAKTVIKPKKPNYEETKSKIYHELYSRMQEEKTRDYIDELCKKADIKYLNSIDILQYAHSGRDN